MGKPKVTWWVPRWAFAPRLWKSLQVSILNRGSLTRIGVLSLIAFVLIVLPLKFAFPALVLPNPWLMAMLVPGMVIAMVLQFGVLAVIPPQVTVRNDRIQKSHGQTGIQIKAADFISAQIIVHRDDLVRLKVRYRRRQRLRTLVLGVASTVDLDQLVGILPVAPAIRDARSRSIGADSVSRDA